MVNVFRSLKYKIVGTWFCWGRSIPNGRRYVLDVKIETRPSFPLDVWHISDAQNWMRKFWRRSQGASLRLRRRWLVRGNGEMLKGWVNRFVIVWFHFMHLVRMKNPFPNFLSVPTFPKSKNNHSGGSFASKSFPKSAFDLDVHWIAWRMWRGQSSPGVELCVYPVIYNSSIEWKTYCLVYGVIARHCDRVSGYMRGVEYF